MRVIFCYIPSGDELTVPVGVLLAKDKQAFAELCEACGYELNKRHMFIKKGKVLKVIRRLAKSMYSELPSDVQLGDITDDLPDTQLVWYLNRLYKDLKCWAQADEEAGEGLEIDDESLEALACSLHEPYYRQFFGEENKHKLRS